ncbi:DHH family phosphoesterase [Enterococcus sp. AD013-P3]|uniref:DHH family phosphoesterase n=1 Tax=Enterococcus sp. AD013-P3 TaxID=3411036 RepID=UPI003B955997
MNQKRFVQILVLMTLIQVLCILLIPWRWLLVLLAVIAAFCIYGLYREVRRFLQMSEKERINQAADLAETNSEYLSKLAPYPLYMYDEQNHIRWLNDKAIALQEKYGDQLWAEQLQPAIKAQRETGRITMKDSNLRYRIDFDKRIIFVENISQEVAAIQRQREQQAAIGFISIDNYDDVIDQMDDKEVSYLNSFVTTFISDWGDEYRIYYKRLNAERYFFTSRLEDIIRMEQDNFSIVERLRKAAEDQNFALTISMGIAYGDDTLERIGDTAQNNLDIALVRGGDQVVLKDVDEAAKPKFYGGTTTSTAKRTRVRSRAMSTALKKIFQEADQIFVMGHRFPDMDAIGSAFGVSCLADFQGKESYVVINERELIPDVERCLTEIHQHPEMEKKLITVENAMALVKPGSLLVMVDYHKPSMSISQDLYDKFEQVAIIDHHRRGEEFPSKPLLTYIESSASSASELVAELIQYESHANKQLDKFTATLLLAGIFVDTKNFVVRTSPRTFDISSYLKSNGANTDLIQYLLSSDLTSFLEISELVAKSEFITPNIVIACGDPGKVYDNVTAAKTADTLLSMNGVEASFVLTTREDQLVAISARSSGKINVQLVMEALGGGGHFTNAATQIKDKTLHEVKEMLYNEVQNVLKQEGAQS